MTVYQGTRTAAGGCTVTVDGAPLDPRHDLKQFAAVFEWGYDGDGSHQLALALLAHRIGAERALTQYKLFCETVVAEFSPEGWRLTGEEIDSTLGSTVTVPMDLATLLRKVREIKLK
jgi:hypothetical protein